jgi:hypothetical protein
MRTAIKRRLLLIEKLQSKVRRQVHIVKGADKADVDQKVGGLLALGAATPDDAFLCLTGQDGVTDLSTISEHGVESCNAGEGA